MPSLEAALLVAAAGLALSASPGPSMLYVLSRSVSQSRAAGLMSAAGLAVGGMLYAIAAAAGLAALFVYSPLVFALTKFAGAGYLIYLGAKMLLPSDESASDQPQGPSRLCRQRLRRIFYQGVMVELLNPKTLLFFVAFLPQFIDPERGSVSLQMLLLGLLVPLTAVPSDVLVATLGGTLAARVASNRALSLWLDRLGAAILIGLGLRVLFG